MELRERVFPVLRLVGDVAIDPRADFGELAARTLVRDIAQRTFTCVTPDLPLSRLRSIITTERAVAVVDDEGKLQGLVSRSDLAAARPGVCTAADVMRRRVHALPDDAPLAYVIPLMAVDDISEVPLVTDDGRVTAICHALDVIRWVSTRLGFEAH
jgi:CBS domain-containing protein